MVVWGGVGGSGGIGGGGGAGANLGGRGGPGGAGSRGGAGIDVSSVVSTGTPWIVTGGLGGFGGKGGSGGGAFLLAASDPPNTGGDGGVGGVVGVGGPSIGGGTLQATGGSLALNSGTGQTGGAPGAYGWVNAGVAGQTGLPGSGGASGSGVDKAALTVAGSTATFNEGDVGHGGLGIGGYGPSGVAGVDITASAHLTVTSSGKVAVPSNETLANDGVIDNAGIINSTQLMVQLTGTGTVNNTGSILSGYTPVVASSQTVTGHDYAVTLATVEGSLTLSTFSVYAATVAAGGILGIPMPTSSVNYFTGWHAGGGLLGTSEVDNNTDLSVDGTNLATSATGAVPVDLHAHFSQTVDFTSSAPTNPVVGGSYTPTASGGPSGNPVVFSINQYSTACTISGGTVSFVASGTCVINADQAAGGYYDAASPAGQSVVVGTTAQSIMFTSTAPTSVVPGDTYTVTAAGGGSGNPVTFSLDGTSTGCTISGDTVTFTGAGTCVINADQAGNAAFDAAPQVQQSIPVGTVAQAISFTSTPPTDAAPGDSYTVTASGGGSGNPVTFSLDGTSTGCTISGDTVTFTGTGTCVINADQAGNAGYDAAPQVQQTVPIGTTVGGIVTEAPSGLPLANVCVSLWSGAAQLRTTCTGADGTYQMLDVAAGTYTVSFVDSAGIHQTQWAGGATTQGASTPVDVGDHGASTVDAALSGVPGSISGTVHHDGLDPSTQECVYLYSPGAAGAYAGQATCTNDAGTYLLAGMAPGPYVVAFVDPMGLTPTVWSGGAATQAEATTITVTADAAVTGVDVSPLPAPGTIVGQVTGADGTTTLPNICVYAYLYDPVSRQLSSSTPTAATCTNARGGYVLSGLTTDANANYQLAFVDPTGTYPTQWTIARRSEGPSTSYWTAPRFSPFEYMILSTTPYGYASPSLLAGGSISGTVLDAATGAPRVGACVYVDYTTDGAYVGQGAVTDANGHYTLTNLTPSQGLSNAGYKVGFYADCSPNQPPTTHWNGGSASEATAANVNVASTFDTNHIDASF